MHFAYFVKKIVVSFIDQQVIKDALSYFDVYCDLKISMILLEAHFVIM